MTSKDKAKAVIGAFRGRCFKHVEADMYIRSFPSYGIVVYTFGDGAYACSKRDAAWSISYCLDAVRTGAFVELEIGDE